MMKTPKRKFSCEEWVGFVLSGGFGIALLSMGFLGLNFTINSKGRIEARVAQLRSVSATELAAAPLGREVVVKGHISERMQPKRDKFAAYIVFCKRSDPENPRSCSKEEDVRPPLLVETSGGPIEVQNYTLATPSHPTDDSDYSIAGVTPRQTVVVGGFVAGRSKLPTLDQATFLEPPDSYASYLRDENSTELPIDLFMLVTLSVWGAATVHSVVWKIRQ